MKHLKIFLLLFIFATLNISYAIETTMYACCSPFGICDLRLFDSRSLCMASCSGHNRCEARTVQSAVTVAPAAYRAPYISPVAAAVSTRATPYGITPTAPVAPVVAQPVAPIVTPTTPATTRVVETGVVTTTAVP